MDSYSYWLNEPIQDPSEGHSQTTLETSEKAPAREHIPTSIVAANLITKLGQMLVRRLAPASDEPTITEQVDQHDQRWWLVYDPYAGKSRWFASEADVMVWLDNYRYR
jgi:hypothetical protein